MITISVCIGSACHKRGSYALMDRFKQLVQKYNVADKVSVLPVFCLGECANGISVKIDDKLVLGVCVENAQSIFEEQVLPKLG